MLSTMFVACATLGPSPGAVQDDPATRYVPVPISAQESLPASEAEGEAEVEDEAAVGEIAIGVERIAFARNLAVLASSTGADALQQFSTYGRFVRAEAGETVELAALRHGEDPEAVRLLNGLEPGQSLEDGDILCLERRHRFLPDESIEDLAALYHTDAARIRQLNGLAEGESPDAWRKILVPCPVERTEQGNSRRYTIHAAQLAGDEQGVIELPASSLQHRATVQEGDTWEGLARRFKTTVEAIQRANSPARAFLGDVRVLGEVAAADGEEASSVAEPRVGESVVVAQRLHLDGTKSLAEKVLMLEYTHRADTDDVLALNGLSAIEELGEAKELVVPLDERQVGRGAVQFFGAGNVVVRRIDNLQANRIRIVGEDPGQAAVIEFVAGVRNAAGDEAADAADAVEAAGEMEAAGAVELARPVPGVRVVPGDNVWVAAGEVEAPPPPQQDRLGDYRIHELTLPRQFLEMTGRRDAGQLLEGMTGGARCDRVQEGEDLAAFAQRHGVALERLKLLNPSLDPEDVDEGSLLCVDRGHRVKPGEDLAFVAELYRTDVDTLRRLNDLPGEAELSSWQRLRVPCELGVDAKGLHIRRARYAPEQAAPALGAEEFPSTSHTVVEGDSWAGLAEAQGLSVRQLQIQNGSEADAALEVGEEILIDARLQLSAEARLPVVVDTLESVLQVRLEDVLELNGFERPEQIPLGSSIRVPRHRMLGVKAGHHIWNPGRGDD